MPYDPRKTEKITSNRGLLVPHDSHPFQQQPQQFGGGSVSYKQEILMMILMMISGTGRDSFISTDR